MRYETHEIVKLISRVEVISRAKGVGGLIFIHPHPFGLHRTGLTPVKGEGIRSCQAFPPLVGKEREC